MGGWHAVAHVVGGWGFIAKGGISDDREIIRGARTQAGEAGLGDTAGIQAIGALAALEAPAQKVSSHVGAGTGLPTQPDHAWRVGRYRGAKPGV